MSQPDNRRDLKFETLDEVMDEVNRLHENRYQQLGKWNLAQTCLHLNEWMRYPMDGYPKPAPPMRLLLWLMKITVGNRWKQRILAEGFKPGLPTTPNTVYAPDAAEETEAIAQLQQTAERLASYNGTFHASPLFGESDRETNMQVQLLHCAHHLGFLRPEEGTPQ